MSLEEAITLIEQSRDTQVVLETKEKIIDTLKKESEESQERVETLENQVN